MSDRDDKQFEIYLKSFRPVAPESLPIPAVGNVPGSRRRAALAFATVGCLTAAALSLAAISHRAQQVGVQAISAVEVQANQVEPSTPVLTRLAFDEHHAFDDFMSEKAQSQFPEMKREQSTLRVLAKE